MRAIDCLSAEESLSEIESLSYSKVSKEDRKAIHEKHKRRLYKQPSKLASMDEAVRFLTNGK